MKILPFVFLYSICSVGTLYAADPALPSPANSPEKRLEWCKNNPEKCKEKREMRQEWCQNHPEKCEQRRQERQMERREMREEWCNKHPERCFLK